MNIKTSFAALVGTGLLMITSSAFSWTVTDSFDNAADGAKPSTAHINWFSATKANSQIRYGNSGKSASLSITAGTSGWGEFGGEVVLPSRLKEGNEIWYRVRTYMPTNFDYRSSTFALKFMRTHTAQSNGSNRGYLDLYIRPDGDYLYQSEVRAGQISEKFFEQLLWDGQKVQKGQWETYEVYIKFSTGAGVVRIWKNGKLQYQNSKWETLASATDYVDRALLFTYWNGHAPQSQTMYVDDLFITNDRPSARDSFGNPYIGMGTSTTTPGEVLPSPPILKVN